jgi:N6-L-threonylcarbamoyladenine synthase
MLHKPGFEFSFSGIKTAVWRYVEEQSGPITGDHLADVAASFQAAVVDVLTAKSLAAAEAEGLSRIVVAGGVACNSGLRKRFKELAAGCNLTVTFPSPSLCSDNAAMLGVPTDFYIESGSVSKWDVNAVASWPLDTVRLDTL